VAGLSAPRARERGSSRCQQRTQNSGCSCKPGSGDVCKRNSKTTTKSLHKKCTCKIKASVPSVVLSFPWQEAGGRIAALDIRRGPSAPVCLLATLGSLSISLRARTCDRVLLRRLRPADLSSDSLTTTALTLLIVAMPPALMDVAARYQSHTISVGSLASCGVVTPAFCCTVSSNRSSEPAALTRCPSLTSTTSRLAYQRYPCSKCSYSIDDGQDKIGPAGVAAQARYSRTDDNLPRRL
jgi:hypothetical protein